MAELIRAQTLDDALDELKRRVAENEGRGEKNFIFCEDRLTLLTERAVIESSGGTFSTEVSTFARFLSPQKKVLSKQGSVMALSAILSSCEDLKCFRKNSAQAVYETIAQLAASRVDAEKLEKSAETAEGLLRAKLRDLSLLLGKYEGFLRENGLLDENGYLALLPGEIAKGALADANVFFFAFPSFTAQACEGLRAAMEHAGSVTGIFLDGKDPLYTGEAAKAFLRVAKEFGSVKESIAPSSLSGEAEILKGALFSPERYGKAKTETERVRVFRARDDAEEFSTVCALIKRYVIEKGLRYRDFAVLVEGSGSFLIAEKTFRAYKIPFFADRKRAFSLHPFCALVVACLAAAADGALPDSVDAVLANYYFGKGDAYRNYLLKYGGYRGGVHREIKEGDAVKGYDRGELLSCRARAEEILKLFPAKGTGAQYTGAIRALSALVDAERATEELQKRLDGAEKEFLALSPLEGILTEIEEIAGGQKFTAREFSALFGSGAGALEISLIPQSLDAVFVGDITESRIVRAEVLFCTGLTDALPHVSSDTAVITDGEIRKLKDLEVEIEPAIAVVNARARESVALNLCAFKRAAYFSRPLRRGEDETGESEVLSYLEGTFRVKPLPEVFPYDASEYEPALLALLALREDFVHGRDDEGEKKQSAIFRVLTERRSDEKNGKGAPALDEKKLDALITGGEKQTVPAAGKLYFAGDISPTLLEEYFTCPYRGFAMRGLRLREREERTVLDTDAGTFVHAVLESAAKRFNEFSDREECRAFAERAGRELLLAPRFASLTDTKAGVYTGERLVGEAVAASVAAYSQMVGSSFRVRSTEERVFLPALGIRGKADRVDEADGYVRVIDYKTGEIDDSFSSYYTGRKLQLQLYLLAASQEGKAAGAFYFPAADEFTKEGEVRYRMGGFFCKDDAVLALMDSTRKEGEKSTFFGGGGKSEKGMAQADFEAFLNYSLLVSARAEEEMRAGNVKPSPYDEACKFCKCKGMCGFVGTPRKEGKVRCGEIVGISRGEAK